DELFTAAAPHFTPLPLGEGRRPGEGLQNSPGLALSLDRDLVVSLDCECGHSRPVMKPQQLVGAAEAKCPKCDHDARPRLEHSIEAGSALAKEKLAALGVPPYDIVRVADEETELVFLLARDR